MTKVQPASVPATWGKAASVFLHIDLAQWRVSWLIEHSASHQLFWYIDSLVLRNPSLRP